MVILYIYTIIFLLFCLRFLLRKEYGNMAFATIPYGFIWCVHVCISILIFERDMASHEYEDTVIYTGELIDCRHMDRWNHSKYELTYKNTDGEIVRKVTEPHKVIGDITGPGTLKYVSRDFTGDFLVGSVRRYVIATH